MGLNTESIISIVTVIVTTPPTLWLLVKLYKRRQSNGRVANLGLPLHSVSHDEGTILTRRDTHVESTFTMMIVTPGRTSINQTNNIETGHLVHD
ncbi:hypothetical protein ACN47E_002310 [Coniothyrium glycines]